LLVRFGSLRILSRHCDSPIGILLGALCAAGLITSNRKGTPLPRKPATPVTPTAAKPSAIEQFAASAPDGAIPEENATTQTEPTSSTGSEAVPETQVSQPESPSSPEVQASQPQTPPDFLERVRSLGFQDVPDETTARDRLIESYEQKLADLDAREKRLQEIEPFARYGHEYVESLRQRGQPAPAPADEPKTWWNPPTVDAALVRKYQTTDPATGELRWSADTPAHIRADFEKYEAHINNWSNQLIYHPREALEAPIREHVESMIERIFGVPVAEIAQKLDVNGEQRSYNEMISKYGERIYAKDPITNHFDQSRLTAFGETLQSMLERAAQMGIPRQQDRIEYAIQMTELKHPAKAPENKKPEIRRQVQLRNGATGLPQRNGSVAEGRPQNTKIDPGRRLLQRLEGIANN
jgi:hypothetical protein